MTEILNESSLKRLWQWNEKYACAALSAFRKAKDCGEGDPIYHKENQERNKALAGKLSMLNYQVTNVSGRYPEGGKTIREWSFFVVNQNDDPKFVDEIIKLGEFFEQDSVLIIPKGAIASQNNAKAYLYGTNHCANSWLKWHETHIFERGKIGYSSPIYSTHVDGRPFVFEDATYTNILPPQSAFGYWMRYIAVKKQGLI